MTAQALVAIVSVGAVVMAPLASAAPAHAVQGNLEVSSDAVTFAKTFPDALFSDIQYLVPGDVQEKRLYLRNSGDSSGFLRVTLEDVHYDDLYFANALTIRTAINGVPGHETAISLAQPCWVVTEGQRVTPGEIVTLDTQLLLGVLDGSHGMGATAQFSIGVSLSDTTPGSLPPTECGQPDFSVPVVPRGTSGQSAQATTPVTAPTTSLGNTGGGNLPVLNLPGGIVIDPNTWDLLEELFILLLVVSFLGGGAWFIVAARRRRDDSSEEPEGAA